jgi:hypothetical protein
LTEQVDLADEIARAGGRGQVVGKAHNIVSL